MVPQLRTSTAWLSWTAASMSLLFQAFSSTVSRQPGAEDSAATSVLVMIPPRNLWPTLSIAHFSLMPAAERDNTAW